MESLISNEISVIILTFNEELHIERCIKNILNLTNRIYVIDSESTDNTKQIAKAMGAIVISRAWPGNHALQFNWALENCLISTPWTMRMDCDEYLLPELINELKFKIPKANDDIGGFIIKRRVYFMNKWIKRGGFYPHSLLRIWRTGQARVEDRWMDEHVVLKEGEIRYCENDMVDENLNDLTWWIAKHNNYASREVIDLINIENALTSDNSVSVSLTGEQFSRKRWVKEKLYSKIPLFIRPLIYFLYRYIILLGFLDGIPGLIWHFLQGFWYRFLVDAKMYEIRRRKSLMK